MRAALELAEDLGISQRKLEQLYRIQVGMTPLQYIHLKRIELARMALKQKKQSNTHLAADLGFYDQAHFIREFSSVIGITPYTYMMRKHPRRAWAGRDVFYTFTGKKKNAMPTMM
jgi:AraC-like DNA-binding protein